MSKCVDQRCPIFADHDRQGAPPKGPGEELSWAPKGPKALARGVPFGGRDPNRRRLANTFALESWLLWRVHILGWGPHSRLRAGCTQRHGSNNPHWIGNWVLKCVYIIDDNNLKFFFFQYDNISQARFYLNKNEKFNEFSIHGHYFLHFQNKWTLSASLAFVLNIRHSKNL